MLMNLIFPIKKLTNLTTRQKKTKKYCFIKFNLKIFIFGHHFTMLQIKKIAIVWESETSGGVGSFLRYLLHTKAFLDKQKSRRPSSLSTFRKPPLPPPQCP